MLKTFIKQQRIYFFAKTIKDGSIDAVPDGYFVSENQRTGLPLLKKDRGYGSNLALGIKNISESEKVRASAERLGIDTAGMNQEEIKTAMLEKLSNE